MPTGSVHHCWAYWKLNLIVESHAYWKCALLLSLLKAQLVIMPETQFEKLNEKNYVDWHYMMEAFKSSLLVSQDLKVNLFVLQQDICSDGVK